MSIINRYYECFKCKKIVQEYLICQVHHALANGKSFMYREMGISYVCVRCVNENDRFKNDL